MAVRKERIQFPLKKQTNKQILQAWGSCFIGCAYFKKPQLVFFLPPCVCVCARTRICFKHTLDHSAHRDFTSCFCYCVHMQAFFCVVTHCQGHSL